MTKYTVYVLVDENDQQRFHYVGTTSQPPVKRLSDIISVVRIGRGCKSMLHTWIKDLLNEGRRPNTIPLFEYPTDEEARTKMAELVIEYTNAAHPIKNSYRGTRLCNHQGRKPGQNKEKTNAIN